MNSESYDAAASPDLSWAAPDPATLLAPAAPAAPPQPGPAEVSASEEHPAVGVHEEAPAPTPVGPDTHAGVHEEVSEEIIAVGDVVDELPDAPVDLPATAASSAQGAQGAQPASDTAGAAYDSWDAMLVEEQGALPASELPAPVPLAPASTGAAPPAALSASLHGLLTQALADEDEIAELAEAVRGLQQQLAGLSQLVEDAAHRAVTRAQEEGAGEQLSAQLDTLHQVHTALRTLGTQNGELAHAVEGLTGAPQLDTTVLTELHARTGSIAEHQSTLASQQAAMTETLGRLEATPAPASPEAVAEVLLPALTSAVLDHLSTELTPRMERMQEQVTQMQAALTQQQEATEGRLRQVTTEVSAHVDRAILTLAQTLLRRRGRSE